MIKSIDLNSDVGEYSPIDGSDYDTAIMPYVSSCNIACGVHSGSDQKIKETIELAIEHDVAIGAHPSYNDPKNFGRLSLNTPLKILVDQIERQVLKIMEACAKKNRTLHHVKPHGALYNDMAKNEDLALAIIAKLKSIKSDCHIYGLANSKTISAAMTLDMTSTHEVFADRRYVNCNQLQSRSIKGSVISESDKVIEQVFGFLNNELTDIYGNKHLIKAETICLHSDTPHARVLAKQIFQFIKKQGVAVGSNR